MIDQHNSKTFKGVETEQLRPLRSASSNVIISLTQMLLTEPLRHIWSGGARLASDTAPSTWQSDADSSTGTC